MSKHQTINRPLRRGEYRLVAHTREAAKGWTDMLATSRSAAVDAWERLTQQPLTMAPRQYRLKADFASLTWNGDSYDRWQYKTTNGGRIWYFVTEDPDGKHAGFVRLERCLTGHPKQTDRAASAG